MTESTSTTPTTPTKSALNPDLKHFLGVLMKKMESNIKSEYEEEIVKVKSQVIDLKKRIKELERELKKRTPLATASELNLKKVHSTNSYFTAFKPQLDPNTNSEKTPVKSKKPNNMELKRAKTTMEKAVSVQNVINKIDDYNTPVTDYFGDENLLSKKVNKPKKKQEKKKFLDDIKKPNSKSSLRKRPKPKTPRNQLKRVKSTVRRKKSTGNVIGSPSMNKNNIKVIVGHRYLLLDDRYGICKWTKGNKMGLELEIGVGNCDGELNGSKKFKCKPGMGLFVDINQIQMDCGKA